MSLGLDGPTDVARHGGLPWFAPFARDANKPPLDLLIIQATTFCNIDCRYCYLPDRDKKRSFDLALLPLVFERLKSARLLGNPLTVLWHAGEPLVMPVDYYRRAYSITRNALDGICNFNFNFQTNGTLLSQKYCEFFKECTPVIGTSIDGPEHLTNKWRVSRRGQGVYAAIMRGIDMLKAHSIPFHVIAVITQDSLDYGDELYEFFRDLGAASVGFNIEEIEGVHKSSTLSRAEAVVEKYRAFVKRIYRRIRDEKPKVRFREFDQIENSLRNGTSVSSSLSNPFSIITVGQGGDVSTFSPELLHQPGFVFGNIVRDSFEEIAGTTKFTEAFGSIRAGKDACRVQCGYYEICGGGCPSNKLSENGTTTSTETMNCILTRKVITDVILDELEKEYGLSGAATHSD